ncbi:SusC/RagA family TonB-linked outer membrane protein [Spirosoma pollinicola]|uniref:SusC/RagA family TonB-linked outer membrane protein n=1 Tax=Spirosoma pollinicola TaxID=2057025 RepID=A0A2K8YVZ2_9BACT|nr:TonB-dependent receptor [Spirosoma pollinicola]AUD01728.1 SusC/RagA family TonB-linked outer membrane protein [Spirosoma pollinicola]
MQKQFTNQRVFFLQKSTLQTNASWSRRLAFCSLFLLSLLGSLGAQAQSKVTGKVTDAQGLALPGVSIVVKGTTTGTVSSAQGDYTLNLARGNETIVFSYIGFLTQEVSAASKSTINITLASDDKMLNEVIVVGYGEQKKETVTGSVATVKGSELIKSPAMNLSNSIAGRMPGVIATNASGEPGYDGAAIKIRGSNTLGNNDALIVIDGVPARAGGIDRLNPADIESISVLKDASAAIYGSRAANGVILVTTKRGKTGKPELSYSFNQGFAQATVIPKMATAAQYAELNNEINLYNLPAQYWKDGSAAFKSTGSYTRPDNGSIAKAAFTPDDIKKFQDGSDPWGHPNTDWFGAALKTWSPQSRHTLQLVGGSENVKYLTSVNYQNQDGYYKNSATGYKQYDFRMNLDAKVSKYISTVVGVVGRQENRFFPTVGAGSIFRMLMRGYPNKPAFWPSGQPAPDIENGQQPVLVTTDATGYDKDTRYYLQSNASVTVTNPWIAGLKFTGSVALDKYIQQGKTWQTPWFVYSWDYTSYDANKQPLLQRVQKGPAQATLNQYTNDQFNSLLSGILSYDHVFGGSHAVTLLAGITKEQSNSNGFSGYRKYFASTAIDQLFAGGSAEKNSNTTAAWQRARMSYFGRAGYNFKEKYLAEFLWRYDGSYMFPASSRWGFFPGVTAGWRLSEENFIKKSMPAISSLKLRASWGQLGNDQVYFNGALREYDYLPTYAYGDVANSAFGYVTGGQVSQTLYENGVPNPTLTWEVANNSDIGLEGSLFNGKVFFEFDVFQNKRSNILWRKSASIPQTTGMTLPATNIGKVTNKGYEFRVGYNGQVGELKYNVSVNGGYAKNTITFWDETPGAPEWQKSTGKPIPSNVNDPNQQNGTLLYQYDGIYSTQAEIDANKLDYSGVGASLLRPGDMRLKDINGDGKINGDDRVRADRNNQPRFQGGFNASLRYRNFDFSLLVQASTGGQIFLQTESGTIGNFLQYSYDHRWTVDNPSTVDPRIVDRSNQYFSNGTSYWLKSTDYARLKNVEIGYTLPGTIGSKIGLSTLRVYVNGLNLLTYAPAMKGIFDPESTSGSAQYYPQARVINTGVTVSF